MSSTLDQSEVDALLASVAPAAAQEVERPKVFSRRAKLDDVEVREYDFKRPERVSKDQMRALQTLHEGFARNFGASLSGFLRTIVEVKVASCEQLTYQEFVSGLPNPTSFNLIEASGLEGQMCLELSPLIIYPIIDRLLGGTSQDLLIPQRQMTLIETRLISNIMRRSLTALSEAWANIRNLEFRVAATESNPQLVQIVPPNEVVVVVGFDIRLNNRTGTMNLCIPYNVIEPIVDLLSNQTWFSNARKDPSGATRGQIAHSLAAAPVHLTATLAETTITVRDLLQLASGDLILTTTPATRPVVLSIEGEKKFLAQMGQHRGQRAIKIVRSVVESDRV